MTAEQGLALFDAALAADEPFLAPMRLNMPALRAKMAAGQSRVSMLQGLIPVPPRRDTVDAAAPAAADLRGRLAGLSPVEQGQTLLDMVRKLTAVILGHANPAAISADRAFREMGFDSLTGVELRNRLNTATGLRLPSTTVFDHPTPAALAELVRTELAAELDPHLSFLDELDRLERAFTELDELRLGQIAPDDGARNRIAARLRDLTTKWTAAGAAGAAELLPSASDAEVFDYLETRFGIL
jgi:hypothetical protein